MSHRPKILTVVPHYLPGFKAGGPIRSVANLVARLGNEFDFRVVTRDRDLGDSSSYSGISTNGWQQVGKSRVSYLSPSIRVPSRIAQRVREVRPNLLYFNSFFDPSWCLAPLSLMRLRRFKQTPIIIAPRGQFGAGALQFKATKKRLYFQTFRRLGLARRVTWQATSEMERDDIQRVVGFAETIVLAPNLSAVQPSLVTRKPKQSGMLNLAFYSRVSPKKNLLGAIEFLRLLSDSITFDIWGPNEDRNYERHCRQQIATLPQNIQVRWCGALMPDKVSEALSQYDAMLLPTLGENFGHAIIEALAAGCPVVISDRTPWQNLEAAGVGWDLPLTAPHAFQNALRTLACMDDKTHQQMRNRAIRYATDVVDTPDHVEAHRQLFQLAVGSAASQAA